MSLSWSHPFPQEQEACTQCTAPPASEPARRSLLFGGPTRLSEEFALMRMMHRENTLLWDVRLQGACGCQVPASRMDLAKWSERFRLKFLGEFKDAADKVIVLPDTDGYGLRECMYALYAHEVTLTRSKAIVLLRVSDSLDFLEVKKACIQHLQEDITPANAMDTYCLGDRFHSQKLLSAASQFVQTHFKEFYEGKDDVDGTLLLPKIPKGFFTFLLGSDGLSVATEMTVFRAIQIWVEGKASLSIFKKSLFAQLLPTVRFEHLNIDELQEILQETVVQNNLKLYKMVTRAAMRLAGCTAALVVPQRPVRQRLLLLWRISDWLAKCDKLQHMAALHSPPFSLPAGSTTMWRLRLYPKYCPTGNADEDDLQMGLFLKLLSPPERNQPEKPNCKLHIVNMEDASKTVTIEINNEFSDTTVGWGHKIRFAANDCPDTGFVVNGCLTVTASEAMR